jgi:hypothetical protein
MESRMTIAKTTELEDVNERLQVLLMRLAAVIDDRTLLSPIPGAPRAAPISFRLSR